MNNTNQIQMLLPMFVAQLPTLFVCLIACVVVLGRWNSAPRGALWALIGFGLAMILCVAIPIAQTGAQEWMMRSGGTVSERASVFAMLGFLWSALRAVTYALLLVAVFAGRSTSPAVPTPR